MIAIQTVRIYHRQLYVIQIFEKKRAIFFAKVQTIQIR
jgi:hypothetical protein